MRILNKITDALLGLFIPATAASAAICKTHTQCFRNYPCNSFNGAYQQKRTICNNGYDSGWIESGCC